MKQRNNMNLAALIMLTLVWVGSSALADSSESIKPPNPMEPKEIKAFCLDLNWGKRSFASPGGWKGASPEQTVAWHKTIGSNVIQTFCVSCNGYAWYEGGPVPEQPGLQTDFLREVVKLGHKEGMLVMGYFCVAANPRWAEENPDLSYEPGSTYHLPYTDEYLAYLSEAVGDAVKTTGIDGFMIDWVWQPKRKSKSNPEGKWIDAEKKLYQQLMGTPFPGEDKVRGKLETEYSRKAIDRCWKTIRKAAKDANPNCIVWLTSNKVDHPHVVNSDMYREVDWLMAETGSKAALERVQSMIGEHTRLLTCMAQWNGVDPTKAVPEAIEANIGLYGFAKPDNGVATIRLDRILPKQLTQLQGDPLRIAVLARYYHGKSIWSEWKDGKFLEPEKLPPFTIKNTAWTRSGMRSLAESEFGQDSALIKHYQPYNSGGERLTLRENERWPKTITLRILKSKVGKMQKRPIKWFYITNNDTALVLRFNQNNKVYASKVEKDHKKSHQWRKDLILGKSPQASGPPTLKVTEAEAHFDIVVPAELIADSPATLSYDWNYLEPR